MQIDKVNRQPNFSGAFKLNINSEEVRTSVRHLFNYRLQIENNWKNWGVRGIITTAKNDIFVVTTKKKDTNMKKILTEAGVSYDYKDAKLSRSASKRLREVPKLFETQEVT